MPKKRFLVIGERKNDKYPQYKPFTHGQSASRLHKWIGYTLEDFKRDFDTINVIPRYQDRRKLLLKILDYDVIVILGSVARDSIFKNRISSIFVLRTMGKIIVVLPHPSGLNISANHKDRKIIRIWKSLIPEIDILRGFQNPSY